MTQTNSLPPIFFNHLYVVLDDKTYRAIQASDFLRSAFPGYEQRSTRTAEGESWTGTYYYCRDSYLEFFGESAGKHWQPGAQEGWGGVAFSTDQAGGVAGVRDALSETFHYEPFYELRQLNLGDRLINWFYQVRLSERLSLGSFESWVMEYHPEIFAHKGIPLADSSQPTRLAYLSPWNKRTDPGPEKPPAGRTHSKSKGQDRESSSGQVPKPLPVFSRVIGASVHMDRKRAEIYAEILSLLGYAQEIEGDCITLSAHGFSLCIQPKEAGPDGYRLSSLRLQMSRPSVAPMMFVFAPSSRLMLNEDLTAEWLFGEARRMVR